MEWKVSQELVAYPDAVSFMERQAEEIRRGAADEIVWLLEHPPLYTAGTSAKADDLLDESRFPVYRTGRGGEYTYHGPGQRVAYVMLDLKRLFAPSPPDLRAYVHLLEQWIIATLSEFGVEGETREGRIGVWVNQMSGVRCQVSEKGPDNLTPAREAKIAALGVRVRKWVSYHGIALNVHPELSHYAGIVPCGIRDYGVTSLHALGMKASMAKVDKALRRQFEKVFG